MGLRRVELSPPRLGHPRATAVSAAAGRLAHAVDDIPVWGLSTCASGRAAPSLHPHTPASKGRISKNGGRGGHDPQAGGGAVMGKAVDFLATSAPFRQCTQGEGTDVARRSTALLSPLCPRKLRPDVEFLFEHFS